MIPFITSRTSTWRRLPPRLVGEINGSIRAHSSSVRACPREGGGRSGSAIGYRALKEKAPMTQPKQQVIALLKAIETGAAAPVAVINPHKYIQHNLGAADGLAGFRALLQALPKGS